MEIIIKMPDDARADSLMRYLAYLDYIEIKPSRATRVAGVAAMRLLLENLPEHKHTQAEVNQAVKAIRAN